MAAYGGEGNVSSCTYGVLNAKHFGTKSASL